MATSTTRKRNTYVGESERFSNVSSENPVFNLKNSFQDSGPDGEGGFTALRGGLHCRLPPHALSRGSVTSWKRLGGLLGVLDASWKRLGSVLEVLAAMSEKTMTCIGTFDECSERFRYFITLKRSFDECFERFPQKGNIKP